MADGFVKLIPENSANCLGLKAEADQTPNSRLAFWRNPWLSRISMSPRLDIKRAAYLAIYRDYEKALAQLAHPQAQDAEHLKALLAGLSNGAENPLSGLGQEIKAQLIQRYKSVGVLERKLSVEDRRQYAEFHNTLEDAQRNHGVLWVGGARNKHLANILTCFTYLYGTKPQDNPLMHNYAGSTHETAQDLLFRELREENPNVDIELSSHRRKAVEQYMARIAKAIQRLIKMTPQELEQTFPDDNVKHLAIVRKLKTEFNRLAFQVNYKYRFKNIPNQFNDKTENYLLVRLKPGKEYYEVMESKFTWRNTKKALLFFAIVFAVFVSAGQAATAIFAFSGIMTMAGIGVSSFVTNFLLFFRDIKAMMINVFSGRLFNGMSKRLKGLAIVILSLSSITGLVSGGFAYVALLSIFGITVLSTAPWWLAAGAGFIAGLTVVGMTSLFFMAAVTIIKDLRGKTFIGLCEDAWVSFKKFFNTPKFNQSLVNLLKETRDLAAEVPQSPEEHAVWESKLSAMRSQSHVAKMAHYVRHVAKVILTIVLLPFAIIAAVVATVSFSIVSAKGTTDTMKVLFTGMSNAASRIISTSLAICSGIVNGVLNTKNLVNAANFIAAKASKILTGGVTIIAMVGMLTYHGLLFKAIKGSYRAVKDNPLKIIVPGIRTAISAVLCFLVALNGYGNGEAIRAGGTLFDSFLPAFLPQWITGNPGTFATLCGTSSSIAINLMACNATTLTETPIQYLDANAAPAVEGDQFDEELIPWGSRRPNEKGCGFFGHEPHVNVTLSVSSNYGKKNDADSVPLMSDDANSQDDELAPIPSAQTIRLEVYEELIDESNGDNLELESCPPLVSEDQGVLSDSKAVNRSQRSVSNSPNRVGLFKTMTQKATQAKALLLNEIQQNYSIGEAVSRGDCFYDAYAQALNNLRGTQDYTAKSLREICWKVVNAYAPDSTDQLWLKRLIKQDAEYAEYTMDVQFTADECDAGKKISGNKAAIWGKPEIDGVILSKYFDVNLHVIEVREDEIEAKLLNHISHRLVTNEGGSSNKAVDEIPKDNTICIANWREHFVPLLPCKTFTQENSMSLL